MSTQGVDYSFSRPSPGAIHAAGYRFVIRYLDGGAKGISHGEATALASAGLWIASVYEGPATWMLGGADAGQAAARTALKLGRDAGMPAGRPVYLGCDFDAQPGQIPAVLDCLRGAASVLGKDATGVYGGLAVVTAALGKGVCKWAFQTLAWSGGKWHPGAQIRQTAINKSVGNQAVDLDEAVTADFGQWRPGEGPVAAVSEQNWTSDGKTSLTALCGRHPGWTPAGIIRRTANHDGKFEPDVATWLNAVFEGRIPATLPVPAGAVLRVPA